MKAGVLHCMDHCKKKEEKNSFSSKKLTLEERVKVIEKSENNN